MASVKVKKQDDLRRLMKERRENLHKGKIDSPFAKYNSLNQLSCIICNINIKHNNLWASHIIGKTHKENAAKQRSKDSQNSIVKGIKRTAEQPENSKKIKSDVFKTPFPPSDQHRTSVNATLASYSSSDDDSDMEVDTQPEKSSLPNHSNNSLPSDFFDNPSANGDNNATSAGELSAKKENGPSSTNSKEALPEGFFDDPVLDAKARNIEYKDPVEEEWERFQKTIAEETNVSKTIMEEDLEESTLERDIEQIDEQIHQWERSNHLEGLAETMKSKAPVKETGGSDTDDIDDDIEDDDLLDWRSKGVKKS